MDSQSCSSSANRLETSDPELQPPVLAQKVSLIRTQVIFPESVTIKLEKESNSPTIKAESGDSDNRTTLLQRKAPPAPILGQLRKKNKQVRYSPYSVNRPLLSMNPRALPFISRPDEPYIPCNNANKTKDKNDLGRDTTKVDLSAFEAVFGKSLFPVHSAPVKTPNVDQERKSRDDKEL